MFDIGGTESLVIVLAILLLFGAKRIPDIARSFGSGMREFRRAMREINDEVQAAGTIADEPRKVIHGTAQVMNAPILESPASSIPKPSPSNEKPTT